MYFTKLPNTLLLPAPQVRFRKSAFLFITILLFCSGCIEHRYYVSPFNGNQGTYHTIPLKSDSTRSAFYANGGFSVGGANDQGVDVVVAGMAGLSGSHNLGVFQAFYGLSLSLGNYKVDSATGVDRPGNKSFGGTGLEGGINLVVPIRGGEWRVIGVEGSVQHEFGNYLRFRQALPENAVDLVICNKRYVTVGGYSELIATGTTTAFGVRLGVGTALGKKYRSIHIQDVYRDHFLSFDYFNFTTHLTKNRYTGFLRINAATKASGALIGLNYRL